MQNLTLNIELTNPKPKKRGRKPKIQSLTPIIPTTDIIIPKKRGRKPKNHFIDPILNIPPPTGGNNSSTISKISPPVEGVHAKNKGKKSKSDNTQLQHEKMNVTLSREFDFSTDNTQIANKTTTEDISNVWLNKYQPKVLNEIIGNKEHILKIKKWLHNFEKSTYHTAVISGGHGVGKNLIVRLALQETGYQIKNIYSTCLKNKNIVSEIIHSCAKTKNAYTSLNQTTDNKFAVVIDDTESITLTSEKDNLLELFKLNEKHKYFPIIFISNFTSSS